MKRNYSINHTFRFKRWSRKNFAIFAALHKVISIGKISVAICEKSLEKTKTWISNFLFQNDDVLTPENEDNQDELAWNEIQFISTLIPTIANIKSFDKNLHINNKQFTNDYFLRQISEK